MENTKEKIIEEFDEKYPVIDWRGSPARDEIKRFLLYALSHQKQEIVEEVEEDFNKGMFVRICSSEETFIRYIREKFNQSNPK